VTTGPLRLSGTVEALRSQAVTVPRLQGTVTPMIITRLVAGGTRVEPGDLLVEFDRQEQQRLALDKRAEAVDLDGQIGKKQAEQSAAEAKDQTELTEAQNDMSRARLEMQKNPLISRVDAEKNTLSLEQATAKLEQLRTTFELKRKAAAADLRILQIRRDRAETARQQAERNAQLMEIRAPFAGLVVIKTMYRGGTGFVEILEGDEVRPGSAIIDIVDTSVMQVRARVNQADASLVQPGQPATIRLDGFPALQFHGRVELVTPLAVTSGLSQTVRTLTAIVSVQESHEQLLPDLTASVEVHPGPMPQAAASGQGRR
jgi:multidrug resistance efflux pump